MSMPRNMAIFFSYLFNPILMPAVTFLLAYQSDPYLFYFTNRELIRPVFYLVLTNTFLFPLITILILKHRKLISSLEMRERKERSLPTLLTLFYYILTYFFLRQIPLNPVFTTLLLGCTGATALTLLINLRFKLSIHMVGIGGVIGAITALFYQHGFRDIALFSLLLIIAGIIGTARLSLNAHTPREVYTGGILGFLAVFFTVWGELII